MVDAASKIALDAEDVLLTRREAAAYVRRSVPTLERWAAAGEGPPFRKVKGRPLYSLGSLRRFAGVETDRPLAA